MKKVMVCSRGLVPVGAVLRISEVSEDTRYLRVWWVNVRVMLFFL